MIKALAWLAALAAGAILVISWMLWWSAGPDAGPHTIIVEEGSTVTSVARQLDAMGAIPGNETTFRAYARLLGGNDPIQAGEFEIPEGTSAAGILDRLQHGQPVQRLVTVTEGMPAIIVAERLAANQYLTGDVPPIAEGSLLPNSYSYQRGEARAQVVARMQAAMDKAIAELWPKRSQQAVVTTPAEALILASIVEKETARADERKMVAGVLSNRIRIGMMLGADATTIYPITKGKPLGRMIRKSELQDRNPYNTRAVAGLPPGPITNPGRESIEAVLNPATTDALYYVADGTGGHAFARTLQEHNANAAKWRALRRARGEM